MHGGYLDQLPNPINRIARERFGVDYLYPIQRFVVSNILDGVSQLVILPTGGGKSLCFQLPAVLLPGFTLVILPLLSLMKDQQRRMRQHGIPFGVLRGGQSRQDRRVLYHSLMGGDLKVLLATPEILAALSSDPLFRSLNPSHLVIDEAHCVAEWGESFRPSYLKIGKFIQDRSIPVITAFTATASTRVTERIRFFLFSDRPVSHVEGSADRTNIFYRVIPTLSKSKALVDLLMDRRDSCIVFCFTRSSSEMFARLIRRRLPEREVYFYHAGLFREERERIEKWFFDSKNGILTATSAYGMGVDKPDIRTVVHTDIPPSFEAYLQESGRAGRDGKATEAILLYSEQDLRGQGPAGEVQFGEVADPASSVAFLRYKLMRHYALNNRVCRRQYLLSLLGQEHVPCSGCDVCSGAVASKGVGEAELLSIVMDHPRRLTCRTAVAALRGLMTPEVVSSHLHRLREFRRLRDWSEEDIEEAIENLLLAGKIRLIDRGPWKGKLSDTKRHHKL
jgi:ATP-dependent DNA helicase RecQ